MGVFRVRETGVNAQTDATKRDLIIEDIVAHTGIDEAMIERLVQTFYGRARLDPLIGPIFENKVRDWDKHLGRMCAFWSSIALMSGRYHGQPMVAHLPLPVDTPHFERWLEIFAQAARHVCPPAAAAHFLERADNIAESLKLGVAVRRGEIRPRRARSRQSSAQQRGGGKVHIRGQANDKFSR
jgi:hemoglobin